MVRKAAKKDVAAIQGLYTAQFAYMARLQPDSFCQGTQDSKFIEGLIDSDKEDILVAEEAGVVQGFVLLMERETPDFPFFIKHNYVYLMDIIIAEDSRGKGLGGMLMAAAKDWAKERGLDYIDLDVLSNNDNAKGFYNSLGFHDVRQVMRLPL